MKKKQVVSFPSFSTRTSQLYHIYMYSVPCMLSHYTIKDLCKTNHWWKKRSVISRSTWRAQTPVHSLDNWRVSVQIGFLFDLILNIYKVFNFGYQLFRFLNFMVGERLRYQLNCVIHLFAIVIKYWWKRVNVWCLRDFFTNVHDFHQEIGF